MARNVKLLLTESVDNLGIVGDVVNVRLGYARNFLLPRGLATTPSDELLAGLAEKRKEAEAEVAALRKERSALIERLEGLDITLARACNDQGQLYGSVSQHDLAEALTNLGFPVRPREVRLPHTIKRLDVHEVLIRFDTDLEANIKVHVVADRELGEEEREEMDFDMEGNLIEKKAKRPRKGREEPAADAAEG
jgi:large subunit ribosomal protein L9